MKTKSFSKEWAILKKEDKTFKLTDIQNILSLHNVDFNKKFFKLIFKGMTSSLPKKNLSDQSLPFFGVKTIMIDFALKYEIQNLFLACCENSEDAIIKWDKKFLSKTEFFTFLNEIQKEKFNEKQMITSNIFPENYNDSLSFLEFCQYLFHPKNSIFNPEMTSQYQDMNYPLFDYFVNSSHNTYLLGNQFTGESSIQAYINAFNKGCRCMEIDCWDGPKGNPIVTHGNTLTTKITFQEVIKCINEYGFKNNPYPIVLSIENHCCIQQQDKMVDIMEQIFQDKIWKPDLNNKFYYASPNDLKYKILIKCKGLKIDEIIEYKNSEKNFKIKIDKVNSQMSKSFKDKHEENLKEEICDVDQGVSLVPFFFPKFETWIMNRFNISSKTSMPFYENKREITQDEIIRQTATEEIIFHKKSNGIFISSDNVNNLKIVKAGEENTSSRDNVNDKQISFDQMKIPNFISIMNDETRPGLPELQVKCMSPNNSQPNNINGKSKASVLLSFLVSPKHGKKRGSKFSNDSSTTNRSTLMQKEKNDHKISLKLHNSLALFGYKLKNFEKQLKAYEIASFSEKKVQKYLTKDYVNLVEINKKSFTRMYPKGSRIDSSNYDTLPGFASGIQFIALNFQTNDLNLGIYLSKFQQNGGIYSGYVLKPEYLRDKILDQRISCLFNEKVEKPRKSLLGSLSPFKIKTDIICFSDIKASLPQAILELKIDLLSTFQIINDNGKLLNEPYYIEIFVKGFSNDENSNKKFISPYCDNTFHMIFEKTSINFSFIFPEIAFIVFSVYKKSISSKPIAFYSIPVECIREGYRRVPLMDFYFSIIPGSYLFCQIKKKLLE